MSESYLIPASDLLVEEEIKHSRFISYIFHCQSEVELKCVLTNLRVEYPGASHYCYAFVASAPSDSINIGSSDDGEPSGSAGRPMLAALQGSNIGEVGAVVIRYFGGTKLGVGGLVRAYSSGLKKGLPQLETKLKQIRYPGTLVCGYHQLKDVEHLFSRCDVVIADKIFTDNISIEFAIPKRFKDELNLELATMSQGQLKAQFD
ncbi:YigZ family protein [Shewanella kaireitica]|uniref:YigZ family protein n=1 Tax=Shewanella kaireitica TaxID=212021 RepID=UPI0020105ED2|nr:YigZ family protein [Shewanella kaireitica]MCL1095556.1 YigZ family protein [Shewanella kaireitica]